MSLGMDETVGQLSQLQGNFGTTSYQFPNVGDDVIGFESWISRIIVLGLTSLHQSMLF